MKLPVLLILGLFLGSTFVFSQPKLDEKATKKAIKDALAAHKSGDVHRALFELYNPHRKLSTRDLGGGLKKKYIDLKKALAKEKRAHLDQVLMVEFYRNKSESGDTLAALGIRFMKMDTATALRSTYLMYEEVLEDVQEQYSSFWDEENRRVEQDYETNYLGSHFDDLGWTGSVGHCDPGDIPQEIRDKILRRLLYFRRLAGLHNPIVLDTAYSKKVQAAALMMAANNTISHYPDSSWLCFTDSGKTGARSSLATFSTTRGFLGVMINDAGDQNKQVGHRRNLLSSRANRFWTAGAEVSGSYFECSKTYSKGSGLKDELNRPEFTAFPRGVFPLTFMARRWSFSYMKQGSYWSIKDQPKFDKTTVTVKDANGEDVPVVIEAKDAKYWDPTVVWYLENPPDRWDLDWEYRWYYVTINNIKVGKEYRTISYPVVLKRMKD